MILVLISLLCLVVGCQTPSTDSTVTRTLRVDYLHSGTATEENFQLDGLVREGPWPGPLDKTIDTLGFGKYFFEVREVGSGQLVYSRGFASIFGEYELTAKAKNESATFHESLRFPLPAGPAAVVLKKRDGQAFRELWSVEIDPTEAVNHAPPPDATLWGVMECGAPSEKVDFLLLGDGYTQSEMDKWHADARRLTAELFSVSPFRERRLDSNVWAIDTPAVESGVSRPSEGVHRDSPIGAAYDALGSERYILVLDNKRLRDIAAIAPYEFVVVVVNGRKYGGGGIYNLFATSSSDNAFTPYVFVHELGHHFAGLADEYYTSSVAYEAPEELIEPWEANVTADPKGSKWRELLTPGIPLPTPWPKDAFEELQRDIQGRRTALRKQKASEEQLEALFTEEREKTTRLLAGHTHAGKVGAFEGASYVPQGYYRPQSDCIMFTRDEVGFCVVCSRAIERVFDLYSVSH